MKRKSHLSPNCHHTPPPHVNITSATHCHTGVEATQTHTLQKESVVRVVLAKWDLATK